MNGLWMMILKQYHLIYNKKILMLISLIGIETRPIGHLSQQEINKKACIKVYVIEGVIINIATVLKFN